MAVLDGMVILSLLAGEDLVQPEQVFKTTQQLVLDALQLKPEGASS